MVNWLYGLGAVGLALGLVACGGAAGSEAEEGAPRGSGGTGGSYQGSGGSYVGSGGSYPSSGGTGAVSGATGATGGSGGSGGSASDPGANGGSSGSSGDQYEPPGTNPFVLTESDPLSTFGADVDTASYDIFRRDIEDGRLPDPASVRLEEFVNAFDYEYAPPSEDSEDPFAIHLAAGAGLSGSGTLLFRVGIQGKLAPAVRGPANLVFLVDVSGSMSSADKLPLVKVVLNEALEVLEPSDLVSIVTYAGYTQVALTPTAASEKARIQGVINGLGAGGSTAGGAGMTLAYAQAESAFIQGGINHIVMCTDGDFNVGLSSDQEMLDLITDKRKSGVTLTTLGFGSGNLNDSMMEKVSNAGNGMYSVISSEDQAIKYANDRLLSTMLHIAKDMKLQVEFNRERVLAYRLLGYEDRAIADDDFRDDAVDAGEIGVGHRVTALYEIVPSGGVVPAVEGAPALVDGPAYDGAVEVADGDLVLVKIRYKQPGASEADEAKEVATSLPAADAVGSLEGFDADFRWAAATAVLAEILKESPYQRPELLDVVGDLFEGDPRTTDPDRAELVQLYTTARSLLDAR
jgi:Ca-activated chloride channel homolog